MRLILFTNNLHHERWTRTSVHWAHFAIVLCFMFSVSISVCSSCDSFIGHFSHTVKVGHYFVLCGQNVSNHHHWTISHFMLFLGQKGAIAIHAIWICQYFCRLFPNSMKGCRWVWAEQGVLCCVVSSRVDQLSIEEVRVSRGKVIFFVILLNVLLLNRSNFKSRLNQDGLEELFSFILCLNNHF